jgi:fructose-1,6-bisphosphatase I
VSVLVSEENEEAIIVEGIPHARYAVVFDPLDGYSNLTAPLTTAPQTSSVMSLWERSLESIINLRQIKQSNLLAEDLRLILRIEDVLQPGKHMVAAGYVLYSSSVVMMMSVGRGVFGFTLDPNFGEFVMSHVRFVVTISFF